MVQGKKGPCVICEEEVGKEGVQCDSCEGWCHLECEGITKSAYKVIQRYRGLRWYCVKCIGGLKKVRVELNGVVKDLDEIKSERVVEREEWKREFEAVQKGLEELQSKGEAMRLQIVDMEKEWPKPGNCSYAKVADGSPARAGGVQVRGDGVRQSASGLSRPSVGKTSVVEGQEGVQVKDDVGGERVVPMVVPNISVSEILNRSNGVVVIGDSMARDVGSGLSRQCGPVVRNLGRGGATIDMVVSELEKRRKDEEEHLVVVVGTNNLQWDSGEEMMTKYRKMVELLEERKGSTTLVGIVKRYDSNRVMECKRIVMNKKLKDLIKNDKKVKYMEHEPDRRRMRRDGLHLNNEGLGEFGTKIFNSFISFL
jgi:lysophospholipase L1-like esterase